MVPDNPFDLFLMTHYNALARRSYVIDASIGFLANFDPLKGGLFMALLWGLWLTGDGEDWRRRATIAGCMLGAMGGLVVTRALALLLPFRPRPMHLPDDLFVVPFSTPLVLETWSSFPSDHAALFFALATGVLLLDRRLGAMAYLYALIVICVPRIFVGLHYPSDIAAGAMIGTGAVLGAYALTARTARLPNLLCTVVSRRPVLSYTLLFLFSYEIAVLFRDLIKVGKSLQSLLGADLG